MNKLPLIAKSEPRTTLVEHIEDGLRILNHLQYAFPSAPTLTNVPRFWEILRLCVIFHDLGKGHLEFQKVLRGEDNEWYRQRHELFSLPFVAGLDLPPNELELVKRIVAGHHKTFSRLVNEYIDGNYDEEGEFKEEFDLVDLDSVLEIVKGKFQINNFKGVDVNAPFRVIDDYRKLESKQKAADLKLLLMFGAFKHCDHLASAYVEELRHLEKSDFRFLQLMELELGGASKLYHHQRQAKTVKGNAILTAPTGSGKTETSLWWLENQMKTQGQGRVFFVLPYTASINAMYKRLSEGGRFGNDKVGMLHGKLSAFLYDFFQDSSSIQKQKEEVKRVKEAFRTIETPFKILTPFQLLKHLFGLKGFEKGIFEWSGGYFIFDEIHAYNPNVFAQVVVLLEYLPKVGAKVFIMTATLPSFLKNYISKAIGTHTIMQASMGLYEIFVRHRIVLREGLLSDYIPSIKADLERRVKHSEINNKPLPKILVVCNTVNQAQSVFEAFSEYESILIHSGFNGKDRNDKEKSLALKEPQILVGTQAIEVSLDIDYDIIYTEPAPLDALIQRFGRVNRKRKKGICPCVVFKERNESDSYIYGDEIVARTFKALESIVENDGGIVKEGKLQQYIDKVYPSFDEKAEKEFEDTYNSLNFSIKNNLIPLEHSKDKEEDFYSQFDGIKVLPASLLKEYKNCLDKFDFIGAELLKVQIRKGQFARWSEEERLFKCKHIIEKSNSKLLEIDFFILYKKYSQNLGLLREENETIQNNDNIC